MTTPSSKNIQVVGSTINPNLIDDKANEEQIELAKIPDEVEYGVQLGPASYTPEEERRVRRKMDIYILPLLCFMSICSFLDKANIGNANTAGMSTDLGLSKAQYNLLLTVFYVVYTVCQPEMLLLKFIPPRLWLTFVVFFWGLASTLQAVTTGFGGMMACRVVIAALEAGGGPAISFYFTLLYPKADFGFRWAVFQACACISNAFAGSVAYGLVQANTSLAPWRLIFLVQSSPTIICAVLFYFFIPSAPDQCRFLSPRENEIARERIERSMMVESTQKGYRPKHVIAAFKEPWTYWIAIIHFFGGAAFNSLSVFLTVIISDMGYESINAQGLSAPPYILAYILAVTAAWYSDKYSIRGWIIAVSNLIAAIGYLIIAYAGPIGVRYFAVYITVAGSYVGQPLMFSWCANNFESDSKRAAALVLFLVTGQLGSVLGTNIYNDPPRYYKGNSICAGGLFLSSFMCVTGVFFLKWRNAKKDKKYGKPTGNIVLPPSEDGSDHPEFRFVV